MKGLAILFFTMCFVINVSAQNTQASKLLSTSLLGSGNVQRMPSELIVKGKPFLIYTWSKKWCNPCLMKLDSLGQRYSEIQKESSATILAVCLDKEVSFNEVEAFVSKRNWPFAVLLAQSEEARENLNSMTAPTSYFIDGQQNLIHIEMTYNFSVAAIRRTFNLINTGELSVALSYFNGKGAPCERVKASTIRKIEVQERGQFLVTTTDNKGNVLSVYDCSQILPVIKNGKCSTYYSNGNTKSIEFYQDGYLDGDCKYYNELGVLQKSGFFKKSVKNGEWTTYDSSGAKVAEFYFVDGKANGLAQLWFESGKLQSKLYYRNDLKHGKWLIYFENGNMKTESYCVDDKLDGEYQEWYENGKLKLKAYYKNGLEHGLITSYYSNGNREYEVNKIDGNPIGMWSAWYENGQLEAQFFFEQGKSEPTSIKEWDEEGNLIVDP